MSDNYTGHVEADSDWSDRTDGAVRIRKLSVEAMDNNVYVISCRRTGEAIIVDAAARPERIREAVADTSPIAVVQTHGHWDHVRAWEDLREDPGLPIWGHSGDRDLFPLPPDRALEDEDQLPVGDIVVQVIHLPGHTDGSLLFLVQGDERPHLFSGDTLFPGGHGKTATPQAHHQIMDGLESKIFARLGDDTWVYPGHGDDTTLGAERPYLPEWRQRGW